MICHCLVEKMCSLSVRAITKVSVTATDTLVNTLQNTLVNHNNKNSDSSQSRTGGLRNWKFSYLAWTFGETWVSASVFVYICGLRWSNAWFVYPRMCLTKSCMTLPVCSGTTAWMTGAPRAAPKPTSQLVVSSVAVTTLLTSLCWWLVLQLSSVWSLTSL